MSAPAHRSVPVLPLADVVLFPHACVPVHVADLRHRTLVRDALARERTLAVATLRPGREPADAGVDAFHAVGCLASVHRVRWLHDDRYDLELAGVERVRFLAATREYPYCTCRVEPLPAAPFDADDPLAAMERDALLAEARRLLPHGAAAWASPPALDPELAFEAAVNAIAHALRLATPARLELLELDSVFDRARRLHEHLRRLHAAPPAPDAGAGERN